jgi:hypothetical protein
LRAKILAPGLVFGVLLAGLWAVQWEPGSAQQAQPAPQAPALKLSEAQLDQLVAPIALYPDPLLAQVMMASTYPLEVVEADRWLDGHKGLTGDQLTQALASQTWDQSVKTLAATPSVLDMMSQKLDWTQTLGNAVIAQQPDVMAAVQRLRQMAQSQGALKSSNEQTVSVDSSGGTPAVVIQPASPEVIYVPYYEPAAVYGPWPYAAYPPYYFPAPVGYVAGRGLWFGAGFAYGVAWGHWNDWGRFNWHGGNIYVHGDVNAHWQVNYNHRVDVDNHTNVNVNVNRNNVDVNRDVNRDDANRVDDNADRNVDRGDGFDRGDGGFDRGDGGFDRGDGGFDRGGGFGRGGGGRR